MVQPVPCHQPSFAPCAEGPLAAVDLAGGSPADEAAAEAPRARAVAAPRDAIIGEAPSAALPQPANDSIAATQTRAGGVAAVVSAIAAAVTTVKKTSATSTAKKSTGALAFLDDKNLSTDDKLMKLLVYLESKWQKDIEKRLKEIAATDAKKQAASSSSGGGLFGSVVKAFTAAVPGVGTALSLFGDSKTRQLISQVSGPVIAAGLGACGFPQLAPLALKFAPKVVDALGSAAKAASGAVTSSSSSTSGLSPDAAEKLQLMELQRLMDHQKELFSMVSNMLRSSHDLRMNVIQNLR